MNDTHGIERHHEKPAPTPFWRTRYGIGFLVFFAIGGYFLLTEHLAHVVGALPLLLLLACPLMHVFMHHDHGHHHHSDSSHAKAHKSDSSQTGDTP
jgi:ABC-type nickel/cobalt efflux system permease component RcnA